MAKKTARKTRKIVMKKPVRRARGKKSATRKLRTHAEDVIDKKKTPKQAAREAVTEAHTDPTTSSSGTDSTSTTTTTDGELTSNQRRDIDIALRRGPSNKPLGHGPDTIDFRVPNPMGIKATGTLTDAPQDIPDEPDIDADMRRQEEELDRVVYDEASKDVGLSTGRDDNKFTQPGNILNIDTAKTDDSKK